MKSASIAIKSLLTIALLSPIVTIPSYAEDQVSSFEEMQIETMGENDSDDLLNQYIQQQFDEQLPGGGINARISAPAMNATTTAVNVNQKVYDALKSFVTEVANGTKTSTVFIFNPADYGINTTVTGTDKETLKKEARLKVVPDTNSLLHKLLFECPYELYWFDKTKNNGFYISFKYSGSQIGPNLTMKIDSVEVRFIVNPDYRSGSSDYVVNSATAAKVKKAVENAKNIVKKYAGKTDIEKLVGYKNEITAYTSYDFNALGKNVYYGNSWQLISVFDGDPSTKVVCEGYSKAFQYLCNLSNFSTIKTICVTGKMTGGTGAGSHMWNVVRMPDNKNYLVDLTNTDEGTIGSTGWLFFNGYSSRNGNSYTFKNDGSSITFTYDATTTDYYSANQLELSASRYSAVDPAACMANGLCSYNGKKYWYENWKRQGMYGDPKNIRDKQNLERGREIYDPASDAWYWLDAVYDGAAAFGKEVWMPYIHQNEDNCSDQVKWDVAQLSDKGMEQLVYNAMKNKNGKWVRYDDKGRMMKGWVYIGNGLEKVYPNQKGNYYYYDTITGLMAKGSVTLYDEKEKKWNKYYFDPITGVLQR